MTYELPPVEPRPERAPLDPKAREKTLLESAAKGPAGRWISMAALALSTQGCALSTQGARFFSVLTGEGTRISDIEPYAEGRTYPDIGDGMGGRSELRLGIKPKLEKPGVHQWWTKPEGIFLPTETDKDAYAAWSARSGARPPFIAFESNEKRPTEPMAIVQPRPGDLPKDMLRRGVELIGPALRGSEGIRAIWRDVVRWRQPQIGITISQIEPDSIGKLVRQDISLPLFDYGARKQVEAAEQFLGKSALSGQLKSLVFKPLEEDLQKDKESMFPVSGPERSVSLCMTPLEHPTQYGDTPSIYEDNIVKLAFAFENGSVLIDTDPSKTDKRYASQLLVVKRIPWETEADALTKSDVKNDAIASAFGEVAKLGLGEMRVHIVESAEFPNELAMVAVIDCPLIPARQQPGHIQTPSANF